MSLHIRVHFDGKVLIPDQPVDLPLNQPLDVQITLGPVNEPANATIDQQRKLREFFARPPLGELSLDALRHVDRA